MFCKNCGTALENTAVCPNCGTPTGVDSAPIQNPTPGFGGPIMSEEEYYEAYADKQTKSYYKWTMIICFLSSALAIVGIVLGNIFAIVDLLIFLIIGLLMIKKRSRTLPLVVAIVGGIGSVISMAMTGTPTGIVALIFSITATIKMNKLHKEYLEYKNQYYR